MLDFAFRIVCSIIGHRWGPSVYYGQTCDTQKICVRCNSRYNTGIRHEWSDWQAHAPHLCQEYRNCVRCCRAIESRDCHLWGQWHPHGKRYRLRQIRSCSRCDNNEAGTLCSRCSGSGSVGIPNPDPYVFADIGEETCGECNGTGRSEHHAWVTRSIDEIATDFDALSREDLDDYRRLPALRELCDELQATGDLASSASIIFQTMERLDSAGNPHHINPLIETLKTWFPHHRQLLCAFVLRKPSCLSVSMIRSILQEDPENADSWTTLLKARIEHADADERTKAEARRLLVEYSAKRGGTAQP